MSDSAVSVPGNVETAESAGVLRTIGKVCAVGTVVFLLMLVMIFYRLQHNNDAPAGAAAPATATK